VKEKVEGYIMCFTLDIVLLGWSYFCACIMISLIHIGLGKEVTQDRIKFSSFIIYSSNTSDNDYSQLLPQLYYNSNSATTDSVTTDTTNWLTQHTPCNSQGQHHPSNCWPIGRQQRFQLRELGPTVRKLHIKQNLLRSKSTLHDLRQKYVYKDTKYAIETWGKQLIDAVWSACEVRGIHCIMEDGGWPNETQWPCESLNDEFVTDGVDGPWSEPGVE